jgi:hypothetical protein
MTVSPMAYAFAYSLAMAVWLKFFFLGPLAQEAEDMVRRRDNTIGGQCSVL